MSAQELCKVYYAISSNSHHSKRVPIIYPHFIDEDTEARESLRIRSTARKENRQIHSIRGGDVVPLLPSSPPLRGRAASFLQPPQAFRAPGAVTHSLPFGAGSFRAYSVLSHALKRPPTGGPIINLDPQRVLPWHTCIFCLGLPF